MNRTLTLITALLLFLTSGTHALDREGSTLPSNARLTALYEADQSERATLMKLPLEEQKTAGARVWAADAVRIKEVRRMLLQGEIRSPEDYWHAAFIMQHGVDIGDIRLAYSLGTIAVTLAPEETRFGWITAASWDRIMTMKNQPQWYGTQYARDPETGQIVQRPVAEGAVTDSERAALGVVALPENQGN